jgi:hypothetical protein
MEMAYRERWEAEIAQMRRVLAGFAMKERATSPWLADGQMIAGVRRPRPHPGLADGQMIGGGRRYTRQVLSRIPPGSRQPG